MRIVNIDEERIGTAAELHGILARALAFPAYYGGNLSALADCLEDVDEPTRIVVKRASAAQRDDWLDGFCTVMKRCARYNPDLEVQIDDAPARQATLDDILARLESIERRLEELPAQPAAASAPVPDAAPSKADTCRNLASGSDGDRFKCSVCGCRVSDYLEETRQLIDGLRFCPQCGREVTNPQGSNALGWVGELV